MATTSSNFEIRRPGFGGTISGTLPAAACTVGMAMEITSKNADTGINTFALADGRADGFVTREVRATEGLTAEELQFGLNSYTTASGSTGEIVTPFTVSKPGSLEPLPLELEVEGSDYILGTGTGMINTGTAADTVLSFRSGKFYVAQTNDWAQYRLVKQMTPNTATNTRIYVAKIEAYKVS